MTYGEIRYRLSKLVPGIDPELIDGWIGDRYTEILDRLQWRRLEVRAVIQTTAPYTTGTITLTKGLPGVTGVGTAWLASMNGMGLRVEGEQTYYAFKFNGSAAGVLDRDFEGETGTYSYSLFQSVYPLPDDCKIVQGVYDIDGLPLSYIDRGRSNSRSVAYGDPLEWRWTMDDASNPPRMQLEVCPIPDRALPLSVEYVAEEGNFGSSTSTTLLPWVSPGCLVAGVEADMRWHVKDNDSGDRKQLRFEKLLADMVRNEIANSKPVRIKLANNYRRGNSRSTPSRPLP